MSKDVRRLIFDLDGTLCDCDDGNYADATPNWPVIEKLRQYKSQGYEIVISTSRNMRTFEGAIGKINTHTLPIILSWLQKHNIPHDEVHVGKPWCGTHGFYIDDRALRPDEFTRLSSEQISKMLGLR